MLDEIKNIKSTKKELREFGLTVGFVFGLIGCFLLWRGKEHYFYFLILAVVLLICGLLIPQILKPVQKVWMAIALLIGWVMTRVILSVLFYLVITPLGILARLLGKDALDLKFDRNAHSYWILRKERINKKEDYEKQF